MGRILEESTSWINTSLWEPISKVVGWTELVDAEECQSELQWLGVPKSEQCRASVGSSAVGTDQSHQ